MRQEKQDISEKSKGTPQWNKDPQGNDLRFIRGLWDHGG